MRISKTAWLVLGIGIVVIALVALGIVYQQHGRQQEQLSDALSVAQASLPALASERADWESTLAENESQLSQVQSLLIRTKARFPELRESIEYAERFFELADDWDLNVTNLTELSPANRKVGDVTYPVLSFTIEVKGELTDILDYINVIATRNDFDAATIESVDITSKHLTAEEEEGMTAKEIEEAETPSGVIQVVIYSYKGG